MSEWAGMSGPQCQIGRQSQKGNDVRAATVVGNNVRVGKAAKVKATFFCQNRVRTDPAAIKDQ